MALKDTILEEIRHDGPMTVARFIEHALYDPQHGYYNQPQRRAGTEWVTAPTLSPLFGHTLARGIAPLLEPLQDPMLIDAGTGSGELARDIALGLHEHAPETFERLTLHLVDASQQALQRAQGTLQDAGIHPDDVTTSTTLPQQATGVIVANELLDALPTHLCQATPNGAQEIFLVEGEPTVELAAGPPSTPRIQDHAQRTAKTLDPGHLFEVPLEAIDWAKNAARSLEQGALVIIDYGAKRNQLLDAYPKGTLHAYHHGRRIEEFWFNPGTMDITYRIPFDTIQETSENESLQTRAYTTQGTLLDALGIREIAQDANDILQAKKLIDPQGAGGTFKTLLQTKNTPHPHPWPQGTNLPRT